MNNNDFNGKRRIHELGHEEGMYVGAGCALIVFAVVSIPMFLLMSKDGWIYLTSSLLVGILCLAMGYKTFRKTRKELGDEVFGKTGEKKDE